jgi:atypical dual specificity phosphatase
MQVRGVINMCDEYNGPVKKYQQLGMQHLHLKTVDHFEPSIKDLKVCLRISVALKLG